MANIKIITNTIISIIIFIIILQPPSINGVIQEPSEANQLSEVGKVLFARNNGHFSPFSNYSKLAASFTAKGYTVEEVQTEINESVLEDVSILFVNIYQVMPSTFNQSEITAIESFVHAGGGLIMSGIGGGLDFGVKLGSNLGTIGSHTLEVDPSPLFGNLPTPFINISTLVFEIVLSGTAKTIVKTSAGSSVPNTPIIAVNTFGQGKIIACAAPTIWSDKDWNEGGNDDLIENYAQWYESAEPKDNCKVIFARGNKYFNISSSYSQVATLFESHGYFVEQIQTEINETILAGTSILFVNTYQVANFDQNETEAIESFVSSGGGLIMSSRGGGLDFGVELTSTSLGVLDSHTIELSPHPVTASISKPIISTSAGIYDLVLNGSAQAVVTTTSGSILPNTTIIATNTYGEGKILSSAVSAVWDDPHLYDGGNDELIENYLRWFESEGIKNFVFTRNNGYFSPQNAYGELASYVANMGYQIFELGAEEEPTDELLDTTSILFLNDYQVLTTYSVESQTAIENWVAKGGALIIVSAGIYTLDFGFKMYVFGGPSNGLYDNDSYTIYSHPVTAGITDIEVSHGTGASNFILGSSATVVISTTYDSNSPNRPIVVVNNYEMGKVMGCAAAGLLDENNGFSQNKELVKNFIDWTTTNTTSPMPWISSPSDVTYDEGSTGNTITWTMGGSYPYYYQIFLDDVLYQGGAWSTYPLTVTVDGLSAGTYTFSIHIYDHYGRTVMDSVNVMVNGTVVNDTTQTTTVENTSSETPTTTVENTSSETPTESTSFSFLAMISALLIFSLFITSKRRYK